jgi:phage-related protein
MTRKTRPISWIKAAEKEFKKTFPTGAQSRCFTALTNAAEGVKSDIAKPMHGMGPGVFEIALSFRKNAFRVVYTVEFEDDIWVVHAFVKKATIGIKTPQHEIDLIRERLKDMRRPIKDRQ